MANEFNSPYIMLHVVFKMHKVNYLGWTKVAKYGISLHDTHCCTKEATEGIKRNLCA